MNDPYLTDISACRLLANTLRRETGPIPESCRPIFADLLMQFAYLLEEVPKMRRKADELLETALGGQQRGT